MVMPPPIRPTFDLDLPLTVEQTVAALRRAFETDGRHPFQNQGKHVLITVPAGTRQFWSPYLSLEAQPTESGVRLHGRFSPKPAIWTGFMLSYIALITAGCFGLMFAVSLAMVGGSPVVASVLGLLFLLAALGLYLSSQFGQRIARAQMDELHAMVLGAVGVQPGIQVGFDAPTGSENPAVAIEPGAG